MSSKLRNAGFENNRTGRPPACFKHLLISCGRPGDFGQRGDCRNQHHAWAEVLGQRSGVCVGRDQNREGRGVAAVLLAEQGGQPRHGRAQRAHRERAGPAGLVRASGVAHRRDLPRHLRRQRQHGHAGRHGLQGGGLGLGLAVLPGRVLQRPDRH